MITFPINFSVSGIISLFIWVFIGAFGIPGSSLGIIAAGSLVTNLSSLAIIILIVYIAVVAGDILAYELARFFAENFKRKISFFSFFRNNGEKARELLKNHGFQIIFFTRFALTGLCQVVSYISGFEKFNRKKFLFAVLTGEFLFAIIYSLIGFLVGEVLNDLINTINYLIIDIILLIIVLYLVRYVFRKKKKV